MPNSLGSTFHETVEEGAQRLHRTTPALLATGVVGGLDVGIGVLAALLVMHETDSLVLSALAFTIGFVALTLANSELFTENFLVPIAAVVAHKARWRDIARLWSGTAIMNALGGLLMIAIVMGTFPELADTAIEKGNHYVDRGLGMTSFLSAVLAGIIITLMTWMQHGAPTPGARIVAAVVAAFLLSFGSLSHVIVASLDVFAAIFGGADYGFADWLPRFFFWAFGNMVGGLGLVTSLRLVQVGRERIHNARERELEEETVEGSRIDADTTGPQKGSRQPAPDGSPSKPGGSSEPDDDEADRPLTRTGVLGSRRGRSGNAAGTGSR